MTSKSHCFFVFSQTQAIFSYRKNHLCIPKIETIRLYLRKFGYGIPTNVQNILGIIPVLIITKIFHKELRQKEINFKIKQLGIISLKNEKAIDQITEGILHVHSYRKGPSIYQTQLFFEVLDGLGEIPFKVYFLDNDLIQSSKYSQFLNNQGKGETHCIQNGKIIKTTCIGHSRDHLKTLFEYLS